jgi:N-succinyldiaminopimelate aminotransferase
MNPDLSKLHPYPFEKLTQLKQGVEPPQHKAHISLSIGEPKHASPAFVLEKIASSLSLNGQYPLTRGSIELRQSIASWLQKRFSLGSQSMDAEKHILPVTGTREALFAFAQAVIDRSQKNPAVLMPNPFYQIYEGAALLAGAEPVFYNTTQDTNYLPDFDAIPESDWQRCQFIYICTPGNPTGAVIPKQQLQALIEKAEKYDFIIASDECYSEIYFDENNPPTGLLQAAYEMGNSTFKRCIVFHSLSKRSNLPGMRSGFVAGDAEIMKGFLKYRTYHGCAMPPAHQEASILAWNDEQHVIENRKLYAQKFDAVLQILQPVMNVARPDAGFYLWPRTEIIDTEFARNLFASENVTVLPGQYLSRDSHGINPGSNHIRLALVAGVAETIEAAQRIKHFIESNS